MLFRIAGTGKMQVRMLLQKAHHIAGMLKISGMELFIRHILRTVPAESQYMLHMMLL